MSFPGEAAEILERMSLQDAAAALAQLGPRTCCHAFGLLPTSVALDILAESDRTVAGNLLLHLAPAQAGALLSGLAASECAAILAALPPVDAGELQAFAEYPQDSAGRLKDPRIEVFRATTTVRRAFAQLRARTARHNVFNLYVVGEDGGLVGAIPLHEAALAKPEVALSTLIQAPPVAVSPFASRGEVIETMESARVASLPVVGPGNVPIGVLRLNQLLHEVGKELSSDVVSLTGASKDESALSGPRLAVRKRLPWLLVNLATAFLAASVVALFEDMIARFTALAVLLPVVAGQSGNTGSQALAVVVRGLAVREISKRHWSRVAVKELVAGAVNGLGVAVFACAGVYLWSGSAGLALVIGLAMVLAMATAGVAGAVIPMALAALGQDPAQSSSIVLTTVTDVVGFISFLGLATLFAGLI